MSPRWVCCRCRPLWHAGVAGLAGAAGLATLVRLVPDHGLDITYDYGFLRCLFEFTIGLALPELRRRGLWVPQGPAQCWGFAAGFIAVSLLSAGLIHRLFELTARVRLRRLLSSAPPAPVLK